MLAIVYLSIFYDLLIMYRFLMYKCFRWLKNWIKEFLETFSLFYCYILLLLLIFHCFCLIFIHSAIFPFSIFRYQMKMILLQLSARNLRYSTFITKHSYINYLSKYRNNRINIKDHIIVSWSLINNMIQKWRLSLTWDWNMHNWIQHMIND